MMKDFPVLTITGPRQSGKTTLARHLFGKLPYYNFENPDTRRFALEDPRGFLSALPKGAILDEFQHVPDLVSYMQQIVDENRSSLRFILTGSNHLSMMDRVSQSLAGRTAILKLLPFSLQELKRRIPETTDELLVRGFYPEVYTGTVNPLQFYRSYYETYLQKDVRQLLRVKDLNLFDKFIRLCAGRTGSILNSASLANETGLSVPTIRQWLSVLEASFIVLLLPPFHDNIGKRLTKSPKLYFYDPGLAGYLMGIENRDQMSRDPLRGGLFENLVITEIYKQRLNQGKDPSLFFFRDSHHIEVDVVLKKGREIVIAEIKSSGTFNPDFIKGLTFLDKLYPGRVAGKWLIYDGILEQERGTNIVNFRSLARKEFF